MVSLSVAYLRRRPLETLLCVTLLALGTATIVALLLVGAQLKGSLTGDKKVDQAKRLKELEAENARLKRAVADLTVDKLILKEVAEGKY